MATKLSDLSPIDQYEWNKRFGQFNGTYPEFLNSRLALQASPVPKINQLTPNEVNDEFSKLSGRRNNSLLDMFTSIPLSGETQQAAPVANRGSMPNVASLTNYIPSMNSLSGLIPTEIPNVFGQRNPLYENLLGVPQSQALSKQSNIAGLLGAAAALASGMGRQGGRRSAAQNILGALGAGYGAAGQQYQQGLQNYGLQQQILNQQLQRQKTVQDLARQQQALQSVEELITTDPNVKNNPSMIAYLRNNPDKALEMVAQRSALESYRASRLKPQAPAEVATAYPVPSEGLIVTPDGQPIPPLQKPQPIQQAQTITPRVSELQSKIDSADVDADYFTTIGKYKEAKDAQDIAANLRGLARKEGLVNQVSPELDAVFPTLKKRVESLKKRAPNMTQEQIVNEQNDILKADTTLLESLDPTLQAAELKRRKAQATVIDMGSREMEKQFAAGVVEDTRASFGQAKAAVNTINTIQRLKPIISAGVYEGVLSGAPKAVDQIATALGVSGKSTQEKLQRTAVAMQGLASLELDAAGTMKGQGAITENERSLIARAAGGNLSTFTSTEVQSLLESLDKVARFKVQSHQQNYEVMSSDPVGKKYSKYYKLDVPGGQQQQPSGLPSGVTVKRK